MHSLSLSLHKRVSYSFLSLRIYKPTHTDTHTNIHKYTYVCKITGLYMKYEMQHWDETVNPLMPGGNKK